MGTGLAQSQGVVKGQVVNVAEVQEAIQASLNEAQRYLGYRIPWTYVNIAGAHTSCFNTSGVFIPGEAGPITREDIDRLVQTSFPHIPEENQVLHVIPVNFMLDGYLGVRSPVGLQAKKVEVESHVVMGEPGHH